MSYRVILVIYGVLVLRVRLLILTRLRSVLTLLVTREPPGEMR